MKQKAGNTPCTITQALEDFSEACFAKNTIYNVHLITMYYSTIFMLHDLCITQQPPPLNTLTFILRRADVRLQCTGTKLSSANGRHIIDVGNYAT